MTSSSTTPTSAVKVRLVRCPKCRGILPEVPDVPLYTCGGCGATLRAKIRKEVGESSSSGTLTDDPAQNNDSERASGSKELMTTSSSQEMNMSSIEASERVQFEDHRGKEQSGSNNAVLEGNELTCHEKKEYTEAEEGSTEEAGDGNNVTVDYRFSSPDSQLLSEGYSTTCTPHRLSDESGPLQTDNEQLEQSQEIIRRDSDDHARSRGSVEITQVTDDENNNIAEEDRLGVCVSKSPTTRSFHAYDGSVSSYEGWDDQVLDQDIHLFKKGLFETRNVSKNFDTNGEKPKAVDDVPVNYKVNPNIDLPLRARKFSSLSLNVEQGGPVTMGKNINSNRNGLTDSTTRDDGIEEHEQHNFEAFRPVRNGIRSERDEALSRKTLYRKGPGPGPSPSAGYKNDGPSSYRNKEFMYGSGMHPPEKTPYVVESNRTELLRKVDELRDQVYRSYAKRENTNGKFQIRGTQQDSEQQSLYYNHRRPEQEFLRRRRHDGNGHDWHLSGAHRPIIMSVPFQRDPSRLAFSGEAAGFRHHADYTCLHGCPEQPRCSLQMPLPSSVCCNNHLQGTTNPGHICYHPCDVSGPANPCRRIDSKFPTRVRNSEPLPHDQIRHMDRKVEKLYHRDRRIKRHCRPIAGGAPYVVCKSCKKLLQLPVDFSPSSKRSNKLRCGSCSKVLIFQFDKRTIVPYQPTPAVPPPSEVDDNNSSDATTTRIIASRYNGNEFLHGDEELNSEYDGVSISKQSQDDGYQSSIGASESVSQRFSGEAKMEKLLRGKEVLRRSSGSPLHRLMGYSSPSQVIRR